MGPSDKFKGALEVKPASRDTGRARCVRPTIRPSAPSTKCRACRAPSGAVAVMSGSTFGASLLIQWQLPSATNPLISVVERLHVARPER